jgi:hypothetical protein
MSPLAGESSTGRHVTTKGLTIVTESNSIGWRTHPFDPQRPVGMAAFGCLTELCRYDPDGGIFDFRQQAVETALGRSFRG